jgi:hypothetical protein
VGVAFCGHRFGQERLAVARRTVKEDATLDVQRTSLRQLSGVLCVEPVPCANGSSWPTGFTVLPIMLWSDHAGKASGQWDAFGSFLPLTVLPGALGMVLLKSLQLLPRASPFVRFPTIHVTPAGWASSHFLHDAHPGPYVFIIPEERSTVDVAIQAALSYSSPAAPLRLFQVSGVLAQDAATPRTGQPSETIARISMFQAKQPYR